MQRLRKQELLPTLLVPGQDVPQLPGPTDILVDMSLAHDWPMNRVKTKKLNHSATKNARFMEFSIDSIDSAPVCEEKC